MKKILLILITLFAASACGPSSECVVLYGRVSVWAEACNEPVGNTYEPLREISIYNRVHNERRYQACCKALADWIIASGGEKLDCTKPPPALPAVFRHDEKESE